jgi:hypothetical protein
MRTPDLRRTDDPDLVAAATATAERVWAGATARMTHVDPAAPVAAWALVHGLASLLIEGNVRPGP